MIKQKNFKQDFRWITSIFNGKYSCSGQIGSGAYSKVYLGENQEKICVVIKVIDLTKLQQEEIALQKNEILILQQIHECENAVRMLDFAETNQNIFIVLEYCQLTLEELRWKFFDLKIPEDIVIVIIRQIANGLAYLHNNRIMHRDLRMENIGVVFDNFDNSNFNDNCFRFGTYKLLDFGFSKFLNNSDKTNTMAPEVLSDEKYSFEADTYSLGSCLFSMITGKYPYFEKSQSEPFQTIQQKDAEFDLIENIELRNLTKKMLEPNPQERITWLQFYQTFLFSQNNQLISSVLDLQLDQNSKFYFEKASNQCNLFSIDDVFYKVHNQINFKEIENQLKAIVISTLLYHQTIKTIYLIEDLRTTLQKNLKDIKQLYLFTEFSNYFSDFSQQQFEKTLKLLRHSEGNQIYQQVYDKIRNNLEEFNKMFTVKNINKTNSSEKFKLICNCLNKILQKVEEIQNFKTENEFELKNSQCFELTQQLEKGVLNLKIEKDIEIKFQLLLLILAYARKINLMDPSSYLDTKYIEIQIVQYENNSEKLKIILQMVQLLPIPPEKERKKNAL